eukprot:Nitzschia sp. Nitz4//scaffold267_size26297//6637//7974//NITZ4_008266-RA/size26297-processed-gene-0.4-mRNA-1//-1//CDS//3329544896//511//frame0
MKIDTNNLPFEDVTKEEMGEDTIEPSFDDLSESDFVDINVETVASEVERAIAKVEGKNANAEVPPAVAESKEPVTEPEEKKEDDDVQLPELELGEWAKTTIAAYKLHAEPSLQLSPTILDSCALKDDKIWKHYHDARLALVEASTSPSVKPEAELTADDKYKISLEEAFEREWGGSTIGSLLKDHTFVRTSKVVRDEATGTLGDATIVSTIFSPYCLPRALQFCCRYHRNAEDTEFWATWHIQFISFQSDYDEDMKYWEPRLYEMWELCSNGYLICPSREVPFYAVEDIDVDYLTPNMARKIRKWLFGSAASYNLVDDMTLMKFVFASCGSIENFTILGGDMGHSWTAGEFHAGDMKTFGTVPEDEIERAISVPTNWLEYQCRLITGSLRPCDRWYEPYDQKYHKGKWGRDVMEHRFNVRGYQETREHLLANPHKVWERIERREY